VLSMEHTFFAERVVNIWNSLPHDTVDFSSLSAFKRTIEWTDFSRFLCFPELACDYCLCRLVL